MARSKLRSASWVLALLTVGCSAGGDTSKGEVSTTSFNLEATEFPATSPNPESQTAWVPPDHTDGLDEEWAALSDSWRDCQGTLEISTRTFYWTEADSACEVAGRASLSGGQMTLEVSWYEECESLPWWLDATVPLVHGYEIVGDRLTLVPEDPPTSESSQQMLTKQLARGDIDRQRWEMVSGDGEESSLDICFLAEGPFYSGRYFATDGECSFLSCAGTATNALVREADLTVYTACAGDCPCTGMIYANDQSEKDMSGTWLGANCSRTMSGDFTATRVPFPDGDL